MWPVFLPKESFIGSMQMPTPEFRIYDHLFQLEDIDSDPEGRSFPNCLERNLKSFLSYVEPFAMTYEGSVNLKDRFLF